MRCRRTTIWRLTLDAYIHAAGLQDQSKSPLFRSAVGRTGVLTASAHDEAL
jgi:hypothetical protein